MLETQIKEKYGSIYQCAKLSGIPYTTLSELARGKTNIGKCSAEVVYKLAKLLGVSMESLMCDAVEARVDFEVFKSNVCHLLRERGELDFIVAALRADDIRKYWDRMWYPEAFYLLATVDYLCRLHDLPLCTKYDDIRTRSLEKTLYPRDVQMAAKLHPSLDVREACKKDAISEFLRFNIVEREIGNVY